MCVRGCHLIFSSPPEVTTACDENMPADDGDIDFENQRFRMRRQQNDVRGQRSQAPKINALKAYSMITQHQNLLLSSALQTAAAFKTIANRADNLKQMETE